jgi:hypothetical protein
MWLTPISWLLAAPLLALLSACAATTPTMEPTAATPGAVCAPTDQDRYVYQPTRLKALQACVYIAGTVEEVERDGVDGDIILLVRPDPPYEGLLTDHNREAQHGDLVVEPVCLLQPLQPAAISLCASDPAPYSGPLSPAGTHVWMEGRYVLDLNHGSWAELHPLYRAGVLAS